MKLTQLLQMSALHCTAPAAAQADRIDKPTSIETYIKHCTRGRTYSRSMLACLYVEEGGTMKAKEYFSLHKKLSSTNNNENRYRQTSTAGLHENMRFTLCLVTVRKCGMQKKIQVLHTTPSRASRVKTLLQSKGGAEKAV
jgi:hypothetical protein